MFFFFSFWRTSVRALCQTSLSLAFFQAVCTLKFWAWTFSLTVLSRVVLGRPAGLLQSAGGSECRVYDSVTIFRRGRTSQVTEVP